MRLCSFSLFALCAFAVGGDFLTELKEREATEGLGLVKVQSDWIEGLTLYDAATTKNPRGASNAWLSSDGRVVVWNMYPIPRDQCMSAVFIEDMSGQRLWQLPGKAHAHMAISNDGKKLAFDGTYIPPGPRGQNTTGLHIAEAATIKVETISTAETTSIGWSPDGSSLVYDDAGRI